MSKKAQPVSASLDELRQLEALVASRTVPHRRFSAPGWRRLRRQGRRTRPQVRKLAWGGEAWVCGVAVSSVKGWPAWRIVSVRGSPGTTLAELKPHRVGTFMKSTDPDFAAAIQSKPALVTAIMNYTKKFNEEKA